MFGTILKTLLTEAKTIKLDKSVIFITTIFSIVFGHSLFIMNDINVSLMGTYSVDHASMFDSINKMLTGRTFYNQMAGYHSSYYGWTYFAISFWFLLPVKFFTFIIGANPYYPLYIGLKVLHFVYGLLATISFYYLAKKYLPQTLAVLSSLVLMLASPLMLYEYIFHPETIGVLFLNIACIQLYWFPNRTDKKTYYYITLLFLVLSSLAKPPFLLLALALYVCLLIFYYQNDLLPQLRTKQFWQFIGKTTLFSLGFMLIVNPFFYIQFDKAILRQIENMSMQSNSPLSVQTAQEAIGIWLELIVHDVFMLSALITSIVLFASLYFSRNINRNYYLTILGTALTVCFLVITKFRLFFITEYFIPVLPILTLSFACFVFYVLQKTKIPNAVSMALAGLILIGLSIPNTLGNLDRLNTFYSYKDAVQYKVYSYIQKNVKPNSSIVHDESAGLPDDMNLTDLHYWQHSMEDLKNSNADYVIYNPGIVYNNNERTEQTKTLDEIIKKNHYKKIEKIDAIEIWKKP